MSRPEVTLPFKLCLVDWGTLPQYFTCYQSSRHKVLFFSLKTPHLRSVPDIVAIWLVRNLRNDHKPFRKRFSWMIDWMDMRIWERERVVINNTVRGIKISMMVVTFLFKGVKQTTFKATVLMFVETKILKVRATPLHFLFKIFYFRLANEHEPLESIPLPYS